MTTESSQATETTQVRPLVSIIMGVYNCADTLDEALESIRMQSYPNWELILCDDGSTDDTLEHAQRFAEQCESAKVLRHSSNRGLAVALNTCLAVAEGELVARMDGDDLCDRRRLELLVSFLEENVDIAFVSSAMSFFDDEGVWGQTHPAAFPSPRDLLRGAPYSHAGAVFRRDALVAIGGYSELPRHNRVEDIRLWLDLTRGGYRGANLAVPLYSMRNDREAASRRGWAARLNEAAMCVETARALQASPWQYLRALRPLGLALLPAPVYLRLHRLRRAR